MTRSGRPGVCAAIRNLAFDLPPATGPCVRCGRPGLADPYFAKSYRVRRLVHGVRATKVARRFRRRVSSRELSCAGRSSP